MKDKLYKIVYIDSDNKVIEMVGKKNAAINKLNSKLTIISITLQIGK